MVLGVVICDEIFLFNSTADTPHGVPFSCLIIDSLRHGTTYADGDAVEVGHSIGVSVVPEAGSRRCEGGFSE